MRNHNCKGGALADRTGTGTAATLRSRFVGPSEPIVTDFTLRMKWICSRVPLHLRVPLL